ncbi:MAG TPA: hypothetical protein VNS22_03915 [Geminicoccus sp.]|uniref:hypothetical protein n=1 Tax=Geminicoccus sp. TaxID=2024832 RepID=UPI002BC1438E|nr:hypothetical protein [Geminicoccus sp.]HWL67511.1 hypothetical protein [Geminicoccus sp.]
MRKSITRSGTRHHLARLLLAAASLCCLSLASQAQEVPASAIPNRAPKYFPPTYRAALGAPLPAIIGNETLPATVPAKGTYSNPDGTLGFISGTGAAKTVGAGEHPFFKSLGANGRSCGTCHQPSQAMSVSAADIRARFNRSGVRDPIFAPVDGANCPTLVPASETKASRFYGGRRGRGSDSRKARSLLLNDGLFRIFMPAAPNRDFTIEVVKDPYGCNTPGNPHASTSDGNDGANGTGGTIPIYSMYRRPLISLALDFKTKSLSFGPPGPSGNIMWDGREPSLESQALNATLGHAQRDNRPTSEGGQGTMDTSHPDIAKIVEYEVSFFAAQIRDKKAGALDKDGATGGPAHLKTSVETEGVIFLDLVTQPPPPPKLPFDEFDGWSADRSKHRQSIARGQALFNGTAPDNRGKFTLGEVAGFNDAFPGAPTDPVPNSACATCHNGVAGGSDIIQASQRNIGTAGDFAKRLGNPLRSDLPVFKITCTGDKPPFFPENKTVLVNDPGMGLVTGRCADIGKFSVPTLRGLASHAPYFHDGSANTIADVVYFYNKRFNMGLTKQEKADLINFLAAL